MRKIIVLLTVFVCVTTIARAQKRKPTINTHTMTTDYNNEWREIDSLSDSGLPKSANEKAVLLFNKAKSDKNPPQIVKTLLYRARFTMQLEEKDGFVSAIKLWEQELQNEDYPVKPVMQSLLADMYYKYFGRNQWKILQRTATAHFKNDDIETWSAQQFIDTAANLYRVSLTDERTKTVKTADFKDILIGADGNLLDQTLPAMSSIRPTVFDILAQSALNFFNDDKNYLPHSSDGFEFNQPEYFSSAIDFVKLPLNAGENSNHKLWTLRLYQQLTEFHINDADKTAFTQIELDRYNYLRNQAIIENKDALYLKSLEKLYVSVDPDENVLLVANALADYHIEKGNSWKPNPLNLNKNEKFKAREILIAALKKFPKAYGAVSAREKLREIETLALNVETEKVYLPNEDLLAKFNFTNTTSVFLRLIKVNAKFDFSDRENEFLALKQSPFLKEWHLDLPFETDFNPHSVEFKIDKLPFGQYVLLVSTADLKIKTKKDSTAVTAAARFQVSDLAYFSKNNSDRTEFVVLHRKSGQPLVGAAAEFFENVYSNGKYKNIKIGNRASDASGIIVPNFKFNNSYSVIFSKNKDTLVGESNYGRYYNDARETEKRNYTTLFFLDRSLYRPGQTVYYKALLYSQKNNSYEQADPKINTNRAVTITLMDANGQKVSEQTLNSNNYGTVNGSFVLPSSGLSGSFHLQSSENGYQNFQVEEYKRPKFEVTMSPLKGEHLLNEKITVDGKAIAYTGANLDGAKVRYRVQRSVSLPYDYAWYWGFSREAPSEIAHGDTTSDAYGNFKITFTALPDLQFPKNVKPTFTYVIYADVIDINGETHSAQTQVSIAYTALKFQPELPAKINLSQISSNSPLLTFSPHLTNIGGEAVENTVHYKIELLTPPAKDFITRYWEIPDTNLMSEQTFKKDFPQYPYKNEERVENWMINNAVKEGDVKTTLNDSIPQKLLLSDFIKQGGMYRFTYSVTDKSGEIINEVQHVEVYETSANAKSLSAYSYNLENNKLEVKETLQLHLNARNGTTYFLVQEDYDGAVQNSTWKAIKSSENYTRLTEEKHRGGFSLSVSGVRNNRAFSYIENIIVPFTNKDLQLRYETFREKLEPGAKEEWRLIITGNKKEKVAAEMVAALYDASLDALYPHNWSAYLFNQRNKRSSFEYHQFHSAVGQVFYNENEPQPQSETPRFNPIFNNFGLYYREQPIMYRSMAMSAAPAMEAPEKPQIKYVQPVVKKEKEDKDEPVVIGYTSTNGSVAGSKPKNTPENKIEPSPIKIRTNLNETVFFYPDLHTDSSGNVVIKFTMNEALTRWKFLAFAHTPDLQNVLSEKTIVTQKDVMVVPNSPRFLREGDKMVLTAKINNLSGRVLTAVPFLKIMNPLNGENISEKFKIEAPSNSFEINNGASAVAKWSVTIPSNYYLPVALQYAVSAGNFSDGEENVVAVLTNRELVTETLPLALRAEQTKTFNFEALEKAKSSKTLTHQSLTIEFTNNPVWYAVQALPYIMEYPHECAEQIFSRYYANSIAHHVVKTMPQINAVFKQWSVYEPDALKSNLSKNQDLKNAVLEETPWVMNAQNEDLQKKNIALLFDLNKMADEQATALKKLRERQNADGGISWFGGDKSNWFITQYILSGLGHLKNLGITDEKVDAEMRDFKLRGFEYCRKEVIKYYAEIEISVAKKQTTWEEDHLSSSVLQYYYALSFYGVELFDKAEAEMPKINDYFLSQMKKYWVKRGIYEQTMMGLINLRGRDIATAQAILKSLKERAIQNSELGMYWKNQWSYFWYQQPVETQSLLIEFFDAMNQKSDVEEMKIWLIKNKQTTAWRTTKATSEAIYALLKTGGTTLEVESKNPTIEIGGAPVDLTNLKVQTGTGYFKKDISVTNIATISPQIKVANPNKNIAWGAMYWQYFENFENIKSFNGTPLKLKRNIFKQTITDKGAIIEPIDTQKLIAGDKIIVRIELEVDRAMEFLHLKDYRAAGLEPLDILSGYKYSGGLGFYQSTRDVSTHFFFSYVQPGKYIFEYPLVVNLSGTMSNGYASIQSMYAPEFTAHSEGFLIEVKEK